MVRAAHPRIAGFNTDAFFDALFFFACFCPCFSRFWFLPGWRRQILIAGSMIFYGWSEPVFLLVVIASACPGLDLGGFIYNLPPGGGQRANCWWASGWRPISRLLVPCKIHHVCGGESQCGPRARWFTRVHGAADRAAAGGFRSSCSRRSRIWSIFTGMWRSRRSRCWIISALRVSFSPSCSPARSSNTTTSRSNSRGTSHRYVEDVREGTIRVHAEDWQKNAHRGHAGAGGRRGFQAASVEPGSEDSMVRHGFVHAANLFRFFGLLRHGDRTRSHPGIQDHGKFQQSVSRHELHRFLAALAHLALLVDQGVSLHSAGGKPRLEGALVCEPVHLFSAFGVVAWSGVELRSGGACGVALVADRAFWLRMQLALPRFVEPWR